MPVRKQGELCIFYRSIVNSLFCLRVYCEQLCSIDVFLLLREGLWARGQPEHPLSVDRIDSRWCCQLTHLTLCTLLVYYRLKKNQATNSVSG